MHHWSGVAVITCLIICAPFMTSASASPTEHSLVEHHGADHSGTRLAQDKEVLCTTLKNQYDQCQQSRQKAPQGEGEGQGNSGLASEYEQCLKVIKDAMTAADCPTSNGGDVTQTPQGH